jgi:hypothetical protein
MRIQRLRRNVKSGRACCFFLLLTCIMLSAFASSANASTIAWRYDLLVHGTVVGTPTGASAPTLVNVPTGTPMSIDLVFDSNSPNGCGNPAQQGGVYFINQGGSGNSLTLHFLGYDYVGGGGIEVGSTGPCGSSGTASFLRVFLGNGTPAGPQGVSIVWIPGGLPGFGEMYIGGPNALGPGLLPTNLPFSPFPTFANLFAFQQSLVFESGTITAVPEPATAVLFGTAMILVAARRRTRKMPGLASGHSRSETQ